MASRYPRQEKVTVTCPACSHQTEMNQIVIARFERHTVGTCSRCGALIATGIDETLAYRLVGGGWSPAAATIAPEDTRYFDITYFRADGTVGRRHGWYNPADSLLVQVG